MLLLQFGRRSDAVMAHSHFQQNMDANVNRVHWANVNLSANTLPFFYITKRSMMGKVDGVKKILLQYLHFLNKENLKSYLIKETSAQLTDTHDLHSSQIGGESEDDSLLTPEALDYQLSPEDIFIPFDNGKYQDYGYVMFPSGDKTNDTVVCIY